MKCGKCGYVIHGKYLIGATGTNICEKCLKDMCVFHALQTIDEDEGLGLIKEVK